MKKAAYTILLAILMVSNAKAQIDPHFSQYYAYPLWLNPALTGAMDGNARITANFRNQWQTISNAYRTGALSADFKTGEKLSLGLNIINQAAGTAGYNYLGAYGSFGYAISLSSNENQKLHFGLQLGLINRSFDPSKLQLDNQYNPSSGFDPSLPTFEKFSISSATVFDANAGLFYEDNDDSKTVNFFGGFSVAHLTRARDPFPTEGINSTLPMRFTFHGGVRIKASEFLDITPHAIYVTQQKNQIRALGIYSELKMQQNQGLIFGAMYRVNDAAVANLGYHLDRLIFGFSYDFNTSSLNTATTGQGGAEISISYIFPGHGNNPTHTCPKI